MLRLLFCILARVCSSIVQLKVAHWKIKALVNLDARGALEFGLRELLEICDIRIVGDPQAIENLRLKASYGSMTADDILAVIPSSPPPVTAARAAILTSLVAVSFAFQPDVAEEIVLHAILAAGEGFTEHAIFAYSVQVLFKHGQDLHGEANALSELGGTMLNKIVSP